MKLKNLLLPVSGVFVLTMMLSSCATQPSDRPTTTGATTATAATGPWKTSDLVIQYRQQARDLMDMAMRLEAEAQFYAQRQNQEQAQRSRDLAKEMRAAAENAEQLARQYQQQLPHGQVY